MKKFIFCFMLVLGLSSCSWYSNRFKANTDVKDPEKAYVYLPTGASRETLMEAIEKPGVIVNFNSFKKMASSAGLEKSYKPGKYKLVSGMTNNEIFSMFKTGRQVPVKISFHYARTLNHLAGKLGGKIEADSTALISFWNDHSKMKELYGMSPEEFPALFIPNTYEFYWATDPKEFTDKMQKEYNKFWNEDRKTKADKLGLTVNQVVTLASIVQGEQGKVKEEWPVIARLYLNRLKAGMPLQADPTVVFAVGDFTITRVLDKHLKVESPYNTYLHTGLPPGPIMIPEPDCVDAVLNPDQNDFIYMCAKEDFSGRHNFTASYQEHLLNADRYRKALSKLERSR